MISPLRSHRSPLFAILGCSLALGVAACGSEPSESPASAESAVTSDEAIEARKKDAGADAAVHDAGVTDAAPPVCSNTSQPRTPTDPSNHVIVYPTANTGAYGSIFPSATKSWTTGYKFKVPPLPCSSTFNPTNATFYIWGDIDFDTYGSGGQFPLSAYVYNQIVPQLKIGDTLAESPSAPPYSTTGVTYTRWVVEADYYWQSATGTSYTQGGTPVNAVPGDEVTTTIAYNASSGSITASIGVPAGTSTIVIPRPFPDSSPAAFTSWKDFFTKAAAQTGKVVYAHPQLDVETHFIDQPTICSVLPWALDAIAVPGVTQAESSYGMFTTGSFTCPTSLVTYGF